MKLNEYIWMAVLACAPLAGCSDFLEEYSQDTYYVTSYKDLDELLIGDCYMPVAEATSLSVTQNVGYFLNYLGDEIEEQTSGTGGYGGFDDKERIFGYYTWQQRPGDTDTHTGYLPENATWTEVYRLINVANNIIESVKGVPQTQDDDRLGAIKVRGEAHFLRAAYYFWLVNLYAKPYSPVTAKTDLGIPIKTISKVNDVIYARNTVQEVYDQILADLRQAEGDLAQTAAPKSFYRADSTAVHFLMSRVYLFMQDWEQAARYADKVLAVRSGLVDMNKLLEEEAFLTKTSVENLFSMGGSCSEICCNLMNEPQSFRVSHDLYNAYGEDDLRKSKWWWKHGDFVGYTKIAKFKAYEGYDDPSDAHYYFYNYNYSWNGRQTDVSDKFLFRTAEAYLLKAEAEAYRGNEAEARAALNKLRRNRYKIDADYEVTASGEALVKTIREERFRELALEGARWFDLRRYSVCGKYPESKRIVHEYTYYTGTGNGEMTRRHRYVLEENDPAYTLAIPNEVLDYNVGMPNNERPIRTYVEVPIN